MQALAFILSMRPAVPFSIERPCQPASNGEVRRWFQNKAVRINGAFPGWGDEIDFPITELVFFPRSANRKTTVL